METGGAVARMVPVESTFGNVDPPKRVFVPNGSFGQSLLNVEKEGGLHDRYLLVFAPGLDGPRGANGLIGVDDLKLVGEIDHRADVGGDEE